MTNELKPCPFCGGEAEFYPAACIEQGWYIATVQCVSCAAQVCSKHGLDRTEQEANESAIEAWNTRAERTCTMTKLEPPLLLEGWWSCSECGPVFPPCNDEIAVWVLQQCPRCGAKVVE